MVTRNSRREATTGCFSVKLNKSYACVAQMISIVGCSERSDNDNGNVMGILIVARELPDVKSTE